MGLGVWRVEPRRSVSDRGGKRKIDVVALENFAHLYGLNFTDFETWEGQKERDRANYAYAPGQGRGTGEGVDDDEFYRRVDEIKRNGGKRRPREHSDDE